MPRTQQHMIRRQLLHVEVYGAESDGVALQHRLPELCRISLSPAIEQAMMGIVPAHEHLIIDRIDIDVGTLKLEHLERDLAEAVIHALAKQLREQVTPAGVTTEGRQRRSNHQAVHDALLHFLRTGNLPWWFHLSAGQTLEQIVRASWRTVGQTPAAWSHFVDGLSDTLCVEAARKRLVLQFSPEFLEILLVSLSSASATTLREVVAKLDSVDMAAASRRNISKQLWQTVVVAAAAGKELTATTLLTECWNALTTSEQQEPALFTRLTKHWPEIVSQSEKKPLKQTGSESELRRLFASPTLQHTRSADDDTPRRAAGIARSEAADQLELKEGIYIDCAGVVLLHPFLPQLFDTLGIAAEDRMLQPERALCLLHFLATGQRVAPEYALALPKLLCNVALDAPVDSLLEVSVTEAEEASALLAAVIRHWDALGDTSADGLRGTFLLRSGKLSRRDDGDFVLQVETQSFDILLERLPWGIGAIKLPWMHVMLWVEWH